MIGAALTKSNIQAFNCSFLRVLHRSILNSQVEKILMVLLSSSKEVVEVMEQLCKEWVTPVNASEVTSDTFPVVTRGTLGVVYKVMMATLLGN